jgi:MFS family permease
VSTLAPLRLAPFRNLAAGRVISMLGNAMAPIALAFAVLDLTGSARDLGLVVGARSLTNVVFLLFGGVVADRFPRQRVMVVSSVLAAVTQAAVAALVLTGSATIGLLIGLAALNGLVSAFAFPAAAALMGQTVPDEIRKQANALSRLGIGAAMIVGAAAAGLLVAEFNAGWVIAIDAFTFSVAALFFALVRVPPVRDTSEPRASTIHELRVGWAEFVSRTWLWVVVLGFMFFNAAEVGAISVLGPVMADAEFGRRGWGFVLAAQTAGLVAGALIAMRIRVRRLLFVGVLCTFVGALLPAAMAIIPVVWVLVAVAFATGVAIEQFGIAWETSMQEHVPQDRLVHRDPDRSGRGRPGGRGLRIRRHPARGGGHHRAGRRGHAAQPRRTDIGAPAHEDPRRHAGASSRSASAARRHWAGRHRAGRHIVVTTGPPAGIVSSPSRWNPSRAYRSRLTGLLDSRKQGMCSASIRARLSTRSRVPMPSPRRAGWLPHNDKE